MADYKVTKTLLGDTVLEEIEKPSSGGYSSPFLSIILFRILFVVWGPFWFVFKQLSFLYFATKIRRTTNKNWVRAYLKTKEYYEKQQEETEGLEPAIVPFVWSEKYERTVDAIRKKYSYASQDVVQSKIKALRDEEEPPKPYVRYRYRDRFYFYLDDKGNLLCKVKGYVMDGYDWEDDLAALRYSLSKKEKEEVMDFFFGK